MLQHQATSKRPHSDSQRLWRHIRARCSELQRRLLHAKTGSIRDAQALALKLQTAKR